MMIDGSRPIALQFERIAADLPFDPLIPALPGVPGPCPGGGPACSGNPRLPAAATPIASIPRVEPQPALIDRPGARRPSGMRGTSARIDDDPSRPSVSLPGPFRPPRRPA
jgi:hypothetical protein